MKKISYVEAIESINPSVNCTIRNNNLDNIKWIGATPNITKQQILDEQKRLQNIENNKPENIKKASGKQKLLDLGLTEAEVKALIGV